MGDVKVIAPSIFLFFKFKTAKVKYPLSIFYKKSVFLQKNKLNGQNEP
jgi:hypothetical protein